MSAIQILLLGSLFVAGVYVYLKFQSAIADAVLLLFFIATGIVFVIFPQLTTKIANKLGVGRGTDLVVYLFIVFFIFAMLRMYARIRKVEARLTKVVRENAIEDAKKEEGKFTNRSSA